MIGRSWIVVGTAAMLLPISIWARSGTRVQSAEQLRPPSAFAAIADREARSIMLFREMGKVIQSPRCLNCHPRGDAPTQGDAMKAHNPPVLRGVSGHGVAGLECATCHGPANVAFANSGGSIPGHPEWHLAPVTMAWQGRTLRDICRQIKDPAHNGGKTLAAIVRHNGGDTLVGWAWHPGPGHIPAPGTQQQFGALTSAWVNSGAACP